MNTLQTLLNRYLAANTAALSPSTHDHYRRCLRQFSEHVGHAPTLDDLTDEVVAGWMVATIRSGLTPTTANQRAKQILALWRWAAKQRLADWPTIHRMKEPEPLPVAWTRAEMDRLFSACSRAEGWIGPHRASTWWLSLHWFLYDTAERIGAALAIRREWIDLEGFTAKVPAAVRKGGQKSMAYRLRSVTCDHLARMANAETDTGLVWDRPWRNDQSLYGRYRKIVLSAGLPWTPRLTGFAKIRRSVLTQIEAMGGDAQAFARHSSRRVTDAYIDRSILAAQSRGVWPPPDRPSWIRRIVRAAL